MIERCQNTQHIAVYCVWGHTATDQLECPWDLVHRKKCLMSVWVSELDHGADIWWIMFYLMRRMCVAYQRTIWQQDALWQKTRPAEAVFCWETLGLGIHLDVTLTHTTYLQIVADHKHPNVCSLIAVASFSSIIHPPHCKNCSGMVWGTWQWVQGVALASKFPWHHTEHLWDVLDKHIWSTKAPPHSLQDLMDLLLMFWYQIPHIQRSCEDYASTHQSCFGSLRGTFMILHKTDGFNQCICLIWAFGQLNYKRLGSNLFFINYVFIWTICQQVFP